MASFEFKYQNFRARKYLPFLQAVVVGVMAGGSAFVLKQGVGWIGGFRIHLADRYPTWLVLPVFGLVGGYMAGWMVEKLAPDAAGSGVPQVKASLAGFPIPLTGKIAIVKFLASILALGAGLRLGREGPTVQISAVLARWAKRLFPESKGQGRELIAAGAGAGVAAAFNTPIAGLLFVVEELMQDFSKLTLGTAILGCFVGSVVSRLLGTQELNLTLATQDWSHFSSREIPLLLLIGSLAGVLGALFNQAVLASCRIQSNLTIGLAQRVAVAGFLSGAAIACLPELFEDGTGLKELLFQDAGSWEIAGIALVSQFILTPLAYGTGAPGGLFAPVLILGGSLGYLVGDLTDILFGLQTSHLCTLVGMGAFFSATIRVPITSIVIVFEMTTDFNLVLPLMLTSVTAFLVAEALSEGSLYDRLLLQNGIDVEAGPEND